MSLSGSGLRPAVGGGDHLAEINVTPLVDVVLVLLFIFMITAPLLTLAVDVEVPEVTTAAAADPATIVITLDAEGSVAVDDRIVLLADAVDEVLARRRASPGQDVFIRADRAVPYGYFMSVLDALRSAGITDVALAVESVPPDDAEAGGDGR